MAEKTKKAGMSGFEVAIRTYLDKFAQEDPLFAKTYAKPNKSIKECCAYILQEAKKLAQAGVACISDPDTYAMAVHYYDEDSIKVAQAPKAKVVAPVPALTTKAAPAAPKEPEKPKKLTKAQLRRGEDCFSLFSFD